MRIFATIVVLFGVGLVAADASHGQFRTEPLRAGSSLTAASHVDLRATHQSRYDYDSPATVPMGPSFQRVVIGTTVGSIVGGAAGLGMVAVTRGEPVDGNMLPWGDLAAGALLGSIPGMYLGARIANDRQGNPWLTGAAAVGGAALGLLAGGAVGGLLSQTDTGKAPEVLGITLGVAIPVVLTSLVETRTSRR